MKEPLTVNLALFTHNEIQPDIFTGRNEVLAKVIFSQACVMNSVHGGGLL